MIDFFRAAVDVFSRICEDPLVYDFGLVFFVALGTVLLFKFIKVT